jgi:predicted nucleic acid-binding protein
MVAIKKTTPGFICDAGPLIHLDELGCLDLLVDENSLLVPHTVWVETLKHRPLLFSIKSIHLERASPSKPTPLVLETLSQVLTLHEGEKEALQIALEHPGAILLTDDTAARIACENLGISAHGTIGILIRSIRKQHRTKEFILQTLHSIPERSTLHLKRSLLDRVIQEVQENER